MFDFIKTKKESMETIARRHEEVKKQIGESLKSIYSNEPKTTDNSERLKKTSADLMALLED